VAPSKASTISSPPFACLEQANLAADLGHEHQLAAELAETGHHARARPRAQIGKLPGAGGGAVGNPGLAAGVVIVSDEVEIAADPGQGLRVQRIGNLTGVEIGRQRRIVVLDRGSGCRLKQGSEQDAC
jgi:hypothetical protein